MSAVAVTTHTAPARCAGELEVAQASTQTRDGGATHDASDAVTRTVASAVAALTDTRYLEAMDEYSTLKREVDRLAIEYGRYIAGPYGSGKHPRARQLRRQLEQTLQRERDASDRAIDIMVARRKNRETVQS